VLILFTASVSRAVPSYATRVAEAVHLLANTDPIAVPVFLISVVAFLLLLELYEKFFGYPPGTSKFTRIE
jgi:hypothetical protein